MAKIFTFSTKDTKPDERAVVEAVKAHCYRKHKNFSGLIVELLRKYKKEHIDD